MRIDLSVIIVNWNSKEYLRKCLASLMATTHGIGFEVIVIDSASFDGAERMLQVEFPTVRYIQSFSNIGFSCSNNKASREAFGDYLLFLNPDTEIIEPAINKLYSALRSAKDPGIVGARLLNSDFSLQVGCVRAIPTIANRLFDCDLLRKAWPKSPLWGAAVLFKYECGLHAVEAISGACMMTRKSCFRAVGGFSEDYFMYSEDMDLSHKFREAGFTNYYLADARVVHHGGSSADRTDSRFAAVMIPEATWRFFRKTRGLTYGMAYRTGMLCSALLRVVCLRSLWFVTANKRQNAIAKAVDKWSAVLRWSIKRDELVKNYYQRVDGQRFIG